MPATEVLEPGLFSFVEQIIQKAHQRHRNVLLEHEVYAILNCMGLVTPAHIFVRRADDITPGTLNLFGSDQIVIKTASGKITHKETAGGVQVVHKDLDFIRYRVERMTASFKRLETPLEGVLLIEYIHYSKELGNEVLLGFRESAAFGPVLSFSKGGHDAEHFATHFSPPNLITGTH